MRRLVIGMTGATGAVLGIRLLQELQRQPDVETHLVMSRWARATVELETTWTAREVARLADVVHGPEDQAASISSGSFRTDGMVVTPCSAKTLAAIRAGYGGDLIARAADVQLKEQRRLVLVVRETPLSAIHLENMLALSRMGVTLLPPVPAFYNRPANVDDVVDHIVARVMDQFGLDSERAVRWEGPATARDSRPLPLSPAERAAG
ncbi:non-oxidative hydroxyarylic acid decarboxylases subunit B [Streptomyces africanus]|uniref:non-oxidative hydroxyarylic acid decarboxylases subunit B n=1 Tax=Streptomyces africanus TaxID=231024 RepID=UPI000A3D3C70|nr:non-oxidative hydroxyarylic acid decarboxylases subunit B [Streptomyces africanus]